MGWLQRWRESGTAAQANFNRAAYDAQNQPFTSRFKMMRVDSDGAKKKPACVEQAGAEGFP